LFGVRYSHFKLINIKFTNIRKHHVIKFWSYLGLNTTVE
jgi:hypothetical protein